MIGATIALRTRTSTAQPSPVSIRVSTGRAVRYQAHPPVLSNPVACVRLRDTPGNDIRHLGENAAPGSVVAAGPGTGQLRRQRCSCVSPGGARCPRWLLQQARDQALHTVFAGLLDWLAAQPDARPGARLGWWGRSAARGLRQSRRERVRRWGPVGV